MKTIRGRGLIVSLALLSVPILAEAQLAGKVHRVGVIHHGGEWQTLVDGLRQGLGDLGLEEGKHVVLDVRETRGDLKAVEEAARNLERGKVEVIYTAGTSVTAAAKRATAQTPIVFFAGTDPVAFGLVESIAKPGGRLTGVHGLATDLTGKRLEVLKEIVPRLGRVVSFYDPGNAVAREAARLGREAARRLGVQLVERHVGSIEDLRLALQRLKPREVDAFFYVSDARVISQAQLIIDAARAKKLPTMFHEHSMTVKGAFASYGHSYREIGRLSAKHVQRILAGADPRGLPVENFDKVELALNLRTAREIGLTIPPRVLERADKVIE